MSYLPETKPWGNRTKAFKDHNDGCQPYLKAGTLFRTQQWKYIASEPEHNTPAERLFDNVSRKFCEPGDVLMFLSWIGYLPDVPGEPSNNDLPPNRFWNLTTNSLMIIRGFHWWFEDNLDRLTEP